MHEKVTKNDAALCRLALAVHRLYTGVGGCSHLGSSYPPPGLGFLVKRVWQGTTMTDHPTNGRDTKAPGGLHQLLYCFLAKRVWQGTFRMDFHCKGSHQCYLYNRNQHRLLPAPLLQIHFKRVPTPPHEQNQNPKSHRRGGLREDWRAKQKSSKIVGKLC